MRLRSRHFQLSLFHFPADQQATQQATMTTTNDTTIGQLLAMHDAHYTTMKHELLKLQQAKDDTPAPAPPTPPPAEPAPEPAPQPEHPHFGSTCLPISNHATTPKSARWSVPCRRWHTT